MAHGARLTRLLGACICLALVANSPAGTWAVRHHVNLPEDNDEFRSNSIGVSKAIDLNTRTIAYKDHILKLCYIEKISTQSAWGKDRSLIVHPMLLTNQQVETIGGHVISTFCYGWPSKLLRLPTNTEARRKRSNQQYYFVGRKTRGQTQSQYLQFNGDTSGKAEAESTRQGSKAIVYGSRGMGQAQSQSDPFSCADCPGYGTQVSTGSQPSLLAPGTVGEQVAGGIQYDAFGRPVPGTGPGLLQTGTDYVRIPGAPGAQPIGVLPGGVEGIGDGRVSDGRAPGLPGVTHPGQVFIPGRGTDQQGGGLAPGQQLITPDGRVIISPGGTDQPYPGLEFRPGQVPGSLQIRPGQIEGTTVGGAPGDTTTYYAPGQVPGAQIIHPSQIGGLPQATVGGPGVGIVLTPGQAPGILPAPVPPGIGTTAGVQDAISAPGTQLYDHGGLQRPSGRPPHPSDIVSVTPGGITAQPGQTTYYIPGGLRPRPGDGYLGYYPGTRISGDRLQGLEAGAQEGKFNGQVAGQYRPASGTGGEFSGTFQGRYSAGGVGGEIGTGYQQGRGPVPGQPESGIGGQLQGVQLPGQLQAGYPGYPGTLVGPPGVQTTTTTTQRFPGGQQWIQQPLPGQIGVPSGLPGRAGTPSIGQPVYQPGVGVTTGYPGVLGPPGFQQGPGLIPGQLSITSGGQYPVTPGQPGYSLPGAQQPPGSLIPGQQIYVQPPGVPGVQPQYQGVGVQQEGQIVQGGQREIYGPQQPGTGQVTFATQGGQIFGGGVGDGRGIYQGGMPGTGAPGGLYQVPGALHVGQVGVGAGRDDDSDSQAQSTIQRASNETQASASSSGRYSGGTAQSQVSGSYAGTGSFSASAGTNDGLRGAQTQISGNSEGTLSSSQGLGGRAKSQAQVQLSADTGDTTSSAQTGGLNHGTNTQVQSGIKGGMADAQANGPGSTSSQAQIGFTPYDATTNEDDPSNPHNGGGTASASSGTHAGKSQVQINGKYAFGIRYTGQAQASSANSGYTAENIHLPTMKPIDFSQHTPNKPAKNQAEKVNVRQIEDQTVPQTVAPSTTPIPDEEDSEYDDYEDPNPPPPPPPPSESPRQNLVQQARIRSLMHDALDPLEDIEDHGIDYESDLKHGDVIEPGEHIPGTPGYKIPAGFRGRVAADKAPSRNQPHHQFDAASTRRIVYAVGANANRRGYNDEYGSGYSFQPRYAPIQYGFKSSTPPKNFVSVTKSETGSRNIITGKKTPSIYYTQSSSCGYFTNTCVYSNGRKICLPKPKSNPDGTPIVCRN